MAPTVISKEPRVHHGYTDWQTLNSAYELIEPPVAVLESQVVATLSPYCLDLWWPETRGDNISSQTLFQ
jgi:hypothetical protein